MFDSLIAPHFVNGAPYQHFPARAFPMVRPIHWLQSHFAVGGWSPLQRLSGMLTAHMTRIAPRNGFTWHPHRGLEIYTWVLEGRLYHEDSTGGRGEIGPGEVQRMFSGEYIAHQELNLYDDPVRVIQIWYVADFQHQDVPPHYQQLSKGDLPTRQQGNATIYDLIGGGSAMEQHMTGRLTATVLSPGGATVIEPPRQDESLFLYVTDGAGSLPGEQPTPLGQYDVVLARHDAGALSITAGEDRLDYLSFYLPAFLS